MVAEVFPELVAEQRILDLGDSLLLTLCQLPGIGKRRNTPVVWTNGCFDILHHGHVRYLQEIKRRIPNSVLVVGVNSDEAVRMLKGPDRPVLKFPCRSGIIASVKGVDLVVEIGKDAMKALEILKPDVYAKGGDYSIDTINQTERRFVEGYGGTILLIPSDLEEKDILFSTYFMV
ncbi:MAG TPA: adenylyltransferase/cytidyltransferase family protein, partial [bacterium]|nr:adenylyltransferase/cytidyltransferase family protein [bacterium]